MTQPMQDALNECDNHLDYCGENCPSCKLPVNEYGNTEYQFDNCSFPDCGCDGARLCMANNGASERSCSGNVEGMWSGKTKEQKTAAMKLMSEVTKCS